VHLVGDVVPVGNAVCVEVTEAGCQDPRISRVGDVDECRSADRRLRLSTDLVVEDQHVAPETEGSH
jgi:hypothetical protein